MAALTMCLLQKASICERELIGAHKENANDRMINWKLIQKLLVIKKRSYLKSTQ